MTVDVDDQAGGATTVSIARAPPAARGVRVVDGDGGHAGGADAAVAADGDRRRGSRRRRRRVAAVYRFDVTGATLPAGRTRTPIQIVIPPLIVQGSVDGTTWTDLGTLVPATAPTIVPQGPQFELQLGPATFWWENPTGQPAYQHIRVGLGPAAPSSPVTLADLAAPADVDRTRAARRSRRHQRERGRRAGRHRRRPGPVVGAGARHQPRSSPLPTTDPSYQRIYYRDSQHDTLVTNLFPTGADPNTLHRGQPVRRGVSEQRVGRWRPVRGVRRVPLRGDDEHDRPEDHRLPGDQRDAADVQPARSRCTPRRSPR